jgi:hypothetical protein
VSLTTEQSQLIRSDVTDIIQSKARPFHQGP